MNLQKLSAKTYCWSCWEEHELSDKEMKTKNYICSKCGAFNFLQKTQKEHKEQRQYEIYKGKINEKLFNRKRNEKV